MQPAKDGKDERVRERSQRRSRQAAAQSPVPPSAAPTILGLSLTDFRRLYRWLNLTLVHQAIWPVLLLLTDAPAVGIRELPLPWYLVRVAAPTLAAGLALIYLAQSPHLDGPKEHRVPQAVPPLGTFRSQARLLLLGLTVALAVARVALGPPGPALRLLAFGVADVAAFHLIHFGVLLRSTASPDGQRGAVALFALSWGIRTALLAAVGAEEASMLLGLGGGILLGATVGTASLTLGRGLGTPLAGAAFHWLLIYLILGFTS